MNDTERIAALEHRLTRLEQTVEQMLATNQPAPRREEPATPSSNHPESCGFFGGNILDQ